MVLVHRPTGIAAEAAERRSQSENRRIAVRRLRLALALGQRLPPDAAGPSPRWRGRVAGRRITVALDHADYPALIAEAFDRLEACGWHLPEAAAALDVSPSQLARLCRREPAAWTTLLRRRDAAGLPPLS